jgi:hypothetical protein
MRACIKANVDYLDITAEINVYRLAEQLGAEAVSQQVMLLPGVGWDVGTDRFAGGACRQACRTAFCAEHRASGPRLDVTWLGHERQ